MCIRKVKGGYELLSHVRNGKRKNLGKFATLKEAQEHRGAIHYFENKPK